MGNSETNDSMSAVGYVRVSTTEQAESGAGLEAQRRAITRACDERSWQLSSIYEDPGVSGQSLNRPGLTAALEAVETSGASVLVVAKLDRLSRSLMDFAGVMERSRRRGWHIAALDLGVDTSSPSGEMVANVMATFAQFERRLIGARTKEALQVRRSQGVRLGRPPSVDEATVKLIVELRSEGLSYALIGARLDGAAVPTSRGGKRWHPNTVRQLSLSYARRLEESGHPGGSTGRHEEPTVVECP
jgi:DNA invertase Pin-like site-specific DNA recombinase